jgi:hypothetical protein
MGKQRRASPLADSVRMRIRAAEQLLSASQVLIPRHGWIAVYLAGLSAECSLKALVLCQVEKSRRRDLDESDDFRGQLGHNYEELRRVFRRLTRGRDLPVEWARDLRYIGGVWSVHMRYEPKVFPENEASAVWDAASRLLAAIQRTI